MKRPNIVYDHLATLPCSPPVPGLTPPPPGPPAAHPSPPRYTQSFYNCMMYQLDYFLKSQCQNMGLLQYMLDFTHSHFALVKILANKKILRLI